MITADRMMHTLSVAQKCYDIAKEEGNTEDYCNTAFVTGWLHDIGYMNGDNKSHPQLGADMVERAIINMPTSIIAAVRKHGDETAEQKGLLRILNLADMQVNGKGENVSIEERLQDVGERLGFESEAYKKMVLMKEVLRFSKE